MKKQDIGAIVKSKKVFLTTNKKKWAIVRLYNFRYDMEQAYKKWNDSFGSKTYPVLGASCHYTKMTVNSDNTQKLTGEVATVFLSCEHAGAGIVSHELLHAVLYAHKHTKYKKQYPIVIKNMNEEEKILHNHTFAVTQFYKWFWKVSKEVTY